MTHRDVLRIMAEILDGQFQDRKASFERRLGADLSPLLEALERRLEAAGTPFSARKSAGASGAAKLRIVRELIAENAQGAPVYERLRELCDAEAEAKGAAPEGKAGEQKAGAAAEVAGEDPAEAKEDAVEGRGGAAEETEEDAAEETENAATATKIAGNGTENAAEAAEDAGASPAAAPQDLVMEFDMSVARAAAGRERGRGGGRAAGARRPRC